MKPFRNPFAALNRIESACAAILSNQRTNMATIDDLTASFTKFKADDDAYKATLTTQIAALQASLAAAGTIPVDVQQKMDALKATIDGDDAALTPPAPPAPVPPAAS